MKEAKIMKAVKIPMSATRAVRLAKALKAKNSSIAILLAEGLKNLKAAEDSSSQKV